MKKIANYLLLLQFRPSLTLAWQHFKSNFSKVQLRSVWAAAGTICSSNNQISPTVASIFSRQMQFDKSWLPAVVQQQHLHPLQQDLSGPKPALTLGILVSLLGFWASKVVFVNKFKLMEDMFLLSSWKYHVQPLPRCEGLDLLSSRFISDCYHA